MRGNTITCKISSNITSSRLQNLICALFSREMQLSFLKIYIHSSDCEHQYISLKNISVFTMYESIKS